MLKNFHHQSGNKFISDTSQWKYFTNFLQFLLLQRLSHNELLEKVFTMDLIAIHCNVKENLNTALLYKPKPQNEINEINLFYWLKIKSSFQNFPSLFILPKIIHFFFPYFPGIQNLNKVIHNVSVLIILTGKKYILKRNCIPF